LGDEEQSSGKEDQPKEKSGGLRGVIISAAFTLLGVLIGVLGKGGFDVVLEEKKFVADQKLERQKLDADLVKLALQASGIDKGGETLGFLVDTNLIADPEIRKGVKAYLDAKKPIPFLKSGILLSPITSPSEVTALEAAIAGGVVSESQDGKLKAVATPSGAIELWDATTEKKLDRYQAGNGENFYPIGALSFSPDSGKLLYVGRDNEFRVWDVTQRRLNETANLELPNKPDSAQFSTDSQTIVVRHEHKIIIYDDHGKIINRESQ
jgi:hypothetical protein